MTLAIILPVNSPHLGKSRLRSVMPDDDRHALNKWLYQRTFDRLGPLSGTCRIYAVSKSPEVLQDASRCGYTPCDEANYCDLNGALALAAQRAQADGATSIMILPIDLPLLTTESLREVMSRLNDEFDVVLVEDMVGSGTNLLLWRQSSAARFLFGPDSAVAYADLARQSGLRAIFLRDPILSFDLDTPSDFSKWLEMPGVDRPPHLISRFASVLSNGANRLSLERK